MSAQLLSIFLCLLWAASASAYVPKASSRIAITNAGQVTRFVINPAPVLSQVLVRTKPDGSKTFYVYGVGLLYEAATNGTTRTYHYDYLGSTVAITDDSGQVTDRAEFDPYGTLTYRVGTNDTPFLFNGRYGVMTDANGLLHMRARYYSPYLCRFVSEDPAGFAGGMNFYAYADGNPVSFLDPFGFGAQEPGGNFWQQYITPIANDLKSRYRDDLSSAANLNYNAAATARAGMEYLVDGIKSAETALLGHDGLMAFGPAGGLLEEGVAALRGISAWSRAAGGELITVRTYTGAAGREGITSSGVLDANRTWVTLPGEIPSRAGHLQIEKILEIQPGRGSHFLEFQVPPSNLRVPANGTRTSGGALQFRINEDVLIDPSTFRRPPGRPGG